MFIALRRKGKARGERSVRAGTRGVLEKRLLILLISLVAALLTITPPQRAVESHWETALSLTTQGMHWGLGGSGDRVREKTLVRERQAACSPGA